MDNFTTDHWNQEKDIEMYSTHNKGESVIPETFV